MVGVFRGRKEAEATPGPYLLACRSRRGKRGRPPEDKQKQAVADVPQGRLEGVKGHLLTDAGGSPKEKGHVSSQRQGLSVSVDANTHT